MKNKKWVGYLITLVGVAFVWEIVALCVSKPLLPPLTKIVQKLAGTFFSTIIYHALYSIGRIFLGIAAALVFGYPLGCAMGAYPRVDKVLSPLVYLTYPVPKIALLPLVLLLFGLGDFSKIFLIVLIIIFQIIISVRDGVKSIPKETYHTLLAAGARPKHLFMQITFPATLPKVFTALRLSLGTAVSVLFFTETFGTEYGMGFLIMDSWIRVNYLEMYASILVLGIIGLLLFLLLDLIERMVCRWK